MTMRFAPALALLLAAGTAGAQGTLSGQGFGYPVGQFGARAAATGGSLAEFDPVSSINPATLEQWNRSALFLEYAPEVRQLSGSGQSDRTTTIRFPLAGAAVRLSENTAVGIAVSTFLDRTFSTRYTNTQIVGGDTLTATNNFQTTGAINDIRAAGAWHVRKPLTLGLGLHAFTGRHNVGVSTSFGDTVLHLSNSVIAFDGLAISGGADLRLGKFVDLAASARKGGTIRATSGDTTLGKGRIPDRVSAAVRFEGLAGATIAARMSWEGWSSLDGLGSALAKGHDSKEYGAGADVGGPRFGDKIMMLRAGVRYRTLPFSPTIDPVHELSVTGGFGLPLAQNRASFDGYVSHATRSLSTNLATFDYAAIRERAWTIGVQLTIRP